MDINTLDFVLDNEQLYTQFRVAYRFFIWERWARYKLNKKDLNDFILNVFQPQFLKAFQLDNLGSDLYDYFLDLSNDFLGSLDDLTLRTFERYYHSTKKRKSRTRSHIETMTDYQDKYTQVTGKHDLIINWLTFTFKDKYINLDSQTLRRYVIRFLNAQGNVIDYIGNADYGEDNERLHFHVLTLVKGNINYSPWNSKYGGIKGKVYNRHSYKMTNYIEKLSNHEVKIKANHIIVKNGHQVNVNKLSCRNKKYDNSIYDTYDMLNVISSLDVVDEVLPF